MMMHDLLMLIVLLLVGLMVVQVLPLHHSFNSFHHHHLMMIHHPYHHQYQSHILLFLFNHFLSLYLYSNYFLNDDNGFDDVISSKPLFPSPYSLHIDVDVDVVVGGEIELNWIGLD